MLMCFLMLVKMSTVLVQTPQAKMDKRNDLASYCIVNVCHSVFVTTLGINVGISVMVFFFSLAATRRIR